MELNKGQQLAVEQFYDWYKYPGRRKRPWFEISGAAGTGKTTTVKEAMKYAGIDEEYALYLAFVGKATLALRLAGCDAYTIHSMIYDIVTEYKRDEFTNEIIFGPNNKPITTRAFRLKDELDKPYQIIVNDEAGMIGDNLGRDVLSFGIPTMCLGDLNQLPPVMAKRIFLSKPDAILTEIMRQEKDSPIIYLSQLAINRIKIPYGTHGADNECRIIPKHKLTMEDLAEADIVITETNQMRDVINSFIRKNIQGIDSNKIEVGDKLIFRQNRPFIKLDEYVSIVNGLIGYVENVYTNPRKPGSVMEIDFRPEFYDDKMFTRVPIRPDYPFLSFADRKNINPMTVGFNNILVEFGNAITCHLSQGSQYDDVIVYMERYTDSEYFAQWLYTAITRAKKRLTIVY